MTLLVGACVVVMTLLVVAMVVAAAAGAGWAILSRTRTCARGHTHASKIVDTGEYARIRVRV